MRVFGAPQGYETAHSSLMKGRSFCSFCVSSVCDIGHWLQDQPKWGKGFTSLSFLCIYIMGSRWVILMMLHMRHSNWRRGLWVDKEMRWSDPEELLAQFLLNWAWQSRNWWLNTCMVNLLLVFWSLANLCCLLVYRCL